MYFNKWLDNYRLTLSNKRSISAAHLVNEWLQKLYRGFLINSINVIKSPHGCGRLTINLSRSTLELNKCNIDYL